MRVRVRVRAQARALLADGRCLVREVPFRFGIDPQRHALPPRRKTENDDRERWRVPGGVRGGLPGPRAALHGSRGMQVGSEGRGHSGAAARPETAAASRRPAALGARRTVTRTR